MSGFIDPSERDRVDRLDALIDLLLPTIPLDALSLEARQVVEDLTSGDPERVRRGQLAYRRHRVTPPASGHEFTEDVADASMCICGVPALDHDTVYPPGSGVLPCGCQTSQISDDYRHPPTCRDRDIPPELGAS